MNIFKVSQIRSRLLIVFLGLALASVGGCRKKESMRAKQNLNSEPGAAQFDVCGLIKNDEMEPIIGSPVKETKASGRAEGGFRVTQCYYSAGESSKSVSLAVTDRDTSVKTDRGAKEFWEDTFGRFRREDTEKESEADKEKRESLRAHSKGEEEEEKVPPKKIGGIGDEAYWSGNRVGGALYVLDKKRDAFVRVSVGGPDSKEKKIEKCKSLALKAIERL